MVANFDQTRAVLGYRPTIGFTEPPQRDGEILSKKTETQLVEVDILQQKVINTAKAVNLFSKTIQSKVNRKAASFSVELDNNQDVAVIASMRRFFGLKGRDASKITYQQYLQCKERVTQHGLELGNRTSLSKDKLDSIRNLTQNTPSGPNPSSASTPFLQLGGANQESSESGGLRPELQKSGLLIEPLDVNKFQSDIFLVLVDKMWNDFLYPLFSPILGNMIPEKIVDISEETKSMLESVFSSIPKL